MAFASFQKRESGTQMAPPSSGPMAGGAGFVKQIRLFVDG
jgi:hypothetical protein